MQDFKFYFEILVNNSSESKNLNKIKKKHQI